MPHLNKLINEASHAVPNIQLVKITPMANGTIREALVEYKGYQHTCLVFHNDLMTHTEEWILDDLIAQFEKFQKLIDDSSPQNPQKDE